MSAAPFAFGYSSTVVASRALPLVLEGYASLARQKLTLTNPNAERLLEGRAMYVELATGDVVCAAVIHQDTAHRWVLPLIYTTPEHRQKGYCKDLLREVHRVARTEDIRCVEVEVHADNSLALDVLEKLKFDIQSYNYGLSI